MRTETKVNRARGKAGRLHLTFHVAKDYSHKGMPVEDGQVGSRECRQVHPSELVEMDILTSILLPAPAPPVPWNATVYWGTQLNWVNSGVGSGDAGGSVFHEQISYLADPGSNPSGAGNRYL